jgi:hypothetical protein
MNFSFKLEYILMIKSIIISTFSDHYNKQIIVFKVYRIIDIWLKKWYNYLVIKNNYLFVIVIEMCSWEHLNVLKSILILQNNFCLTKLSNMQQLCLSVTLVSHVTHVILWLILQASFLLTKL